MTTTDAAPAADHAEAAARDRRHAENLERVIRDLYELHDLGALTHFEHYTEERRSGSSGPPAIDMFRLVFRNGAQQQLTYSQARSLLRGFFLGRDYPRVGVAVAEVATIRHRGP